MKEKSSFDDLFRRKLNELPTPNEDEAWQHMKRLLDKKKDRPALFLLNNYKVVGGVLLLVLLILLSVLIYQHTTSVEKNDAVAQIKNRAKTNVPPSTLHNKEDKNGSLQPLSSQKDAKPKTRNNSLSGSEKEELKRTTATASFYGKNKSIQITNKPNEIKGRETTNDKNAVPTNMDKNKSDQNNWKEWSELKASNSKALKDVKNSVNHHQNEVVEASPINKNAINSSTFVSDSIHQQAIIQKDSLQKADHSDSGKIAAKTNIIIKKRNSLFIEGGIQLQQQIPLGTQKVTAYNYNGNKNVLLDYVPALYLRLEKKDQWFLQGEFDYSSPRIIKQFVYSQHTQTDYAHSTVSTTAYHLQKVFYSQLPISFHYYVQPHWSVGAGVAYNWFCGALVQKTVAVQDVVLGTQIRSQQETPIKNFSDSFLYKTNTSLLLQTNYSFKKWSVGLRYWQDVQPFIKYTLPDGTIVNKRSSSLQLLVSYRLFRASDFKRKKK